MDNPDFMQTVQAWANQLLIWVGFGTIVGLLAKAIMPGKDPGGAIATLAMGVAGTIIGCGVLSYFWRGHVISPISPLGFCVATAGAFVLLFFYKLLGGYYFEEDQGPLVRRRRFGLRRRTRPPAAVVYDDET
ncbi:MAG TPA: GlsB/YeaQ/YmgE family stress response membrane protein [Pirellulaceae bacterium]|nr:GlsB/YeaQ/YmgE family stress response membrane protein [Pirellulaceae bacterium]